MPTSELFSPSPANTRSNLRSEDGSKGLGKGAHAEQKVAINYGNAYVVQLIGQDAFPCSDCHKWFLKYTAAGTKSVVFCVSEDGTADRNYHVSLGLPNGAGYPCLLYRHAGVCTYLNAPGAWPAAPAVPRT